MCGIAGYYGQNSQEKTDMVKAMLKVMDHRGPDHSSVVQHKNAVIGFNRLAINDLSDTGNQPFQVGDTIVYCNGEIYNHLELKGRYGLSGKCKSHSDVEVIPHLFERLGWDFLNEIQGMFAMVLYEESSCRLHLITDRFGKKPMYYYRTNEGYFFASELKAFLLNFNLSIDPQAMNAAFFLGYFPYPLTPVKQVSKIPPAVILTCNEQSHSEKVWYRLKPHSHPEAASFSYYQDLYYQLLDDAVKIRMEADVDVGVYLSGGMDSTSIAQSCAQQGYKNIHAFSGIVSGKEYSTDNQNAARFAREHNFILHEVKIDDNKYNQLLLKTCSAADEIPFESSQLNFISIAKEAREHVTVLLGGVGGDEIFLGYPWHKTFHKIPKFLRGVIPFNAQLLTHLASLENKFSDRNTIYSIMHGLMDPQTWMFFYRAYTPVSMMLDSPQFSYEWLHALLHQSTENYCGGFDSKVDMNFLAYLEILGVLMHQHQQMDRCSMAYSIEPRAPFIDHRLWEAFCSVSENIKLKNGPKTLMRELSEKRLPRYILEAPKDGFSSPLYTWFLNNHELKDNVITLIKQKGDLLESIFGAQLIQRILAPWESGKGVQWMDGIRLHMLVSVVLWHRIYFEDKSLFNVEAPLEQIL